MSAISSSIAYCYAFESEVRCRTVVTCKTAHCAMPSSTVFAGSTTREPQLAEYPPGLSDRAVRSGCKEVPVVLRLHQSNHIVLPVGRRFHQCRMQPACIAHACRDGSRRRTYRKSSNCAPVLFQLYSPTLPAVWLESLTANNVCPLKTILIRPVTIVASTVCHWFCA